MEISEMTLGTVQLGKEYGIANKTGKPTREAANEILKAAYDNGISSFDTASAYGNSEEILGGCFGSFPEGKPTIITKLGSLENISKENVEEKIYEQVRGSLKRLQLKKIPVYLLHDPSYMSLFGDTVNRTMEKLKSQGLIEKAGVSVYEVSEIEKMLDFDVYEAVQLPMNLFDTRIERSGILEKLRNKDFIIFVRSIFLQGLFFYKPNELPQKFEYLAPYLEELNAIAGASGLPISQIAYAFIRDIKEVSSLVIGAETIKQVRENIALMNCDPLNPEIRANLYELSCRIPIEKIMKDIRNK